MASLIPALGACTSRMTSGERSAKRRAGTKAGDFKPGSNTIHVMTMHASKGLANKKDDGNRTIAARNAMLISLDFIALSIDHAPVVGAP